MNTAQENNPSPLLMVSVMLAAIMYAMDTTIANIVLPQMQGSLQASQDQIAWVITSYIVVSAICTPLLSPLAERFSTARVLQLSVALFTVSSLLCGMSQTLPEMVGSRMLQGASGAALVPLTQAILLHSYPRERHAMVLAVWGVGVMLGPIVGPTLGGYLTDEFNWRWVFFINLPVGLLAFLGIAATISRERTETPRPFDSLGYLLIALSIGAFQLLLDRGNIKDWFSSTEIIVEAALAALCLYMFIVHSLTTRHPFFSPALFRDRNFVLGTILIGLVLIAIYANMVLMPLFLQQIRGYSVFDAGILLAPRGAGMALTSILAGRFLRHFEARWFVITGLGFVGASAWWISQFNFDVSGSAVVMTGMLQGMGIGFITVPLMTITFATLDPAIRTEATVLYAMLRNIGGGIGVSVAITILTRSSQANHARLVEFMSVFDTEKWRLVHALFGSRAEAIVASEISRQAAMIAYINDFTVLLILTLGGIPLVLLMRRSSY